MTEVWWSVEDSQTARQVIELGGKGVVEAAVGSVLPNRRVMLRSLTPGISGAMVFLASPVALHDGAPVTEVDGVLKVGRADLLAREVQNYFHWVHTVLERTSDFAPLDRPPDFDRQARQSPDSVVAIHYRRVGNMTFGEYMARCIELGAVSDACEAIDRLLTILRPWQEQRSIETGKALTADGVYGFKLQPFDNFEAECFRLQNHEHSIGSSDNDWVGRVRALWEPGRLHPRRMLVTALHGDLHTENIMVSDDGHLSLIDFGACETGHFLRDICTLEAHLAMRSLVPKNESQMDRYIQELEALYQPTSLLDPFGPSSTTSLSAVVTRLRRYAFAALMSANSDYTSQYMLAILRHAIRVVTRDDAATSDLQRVAAIQVAKTLSSTLTVSEGRLQIATVLPNPRHLDFLDGPEGRWFDEDGLRPPAAQPCTDHTWVALADELMDARRSDLLGLVPVSLLSELLIRAERVSLQARTMYLNYVTTVPAGRGDSGLGYAHPRWRGSLTGMRNLVRTLAGHEGLGAKLNLQPCIRMSSRVSENCLIRLERQNGTIRIFEISRLSEADMDVPGTFAVNVIRDNDGVVSNWVEQTEGAASEIIIREVVCDSIDQPFGREKPVGYEFIAPTVSSLETYGDPKIQSGLRPIALTILRSRGPNGLRILMKTRTQLTDYDTFGKYSFLSTRILVEDVVRVGKVSHIPRNDADADMSHLWEKLLRPEPWLLEQDVFLAAAQRDVYACTLLDLPLDRLEFMGMHLISGHASGIQTCFAVFLVNLQPAEVEMARSSSKGMLEGVVQTLKVVSPAAILDGSVPVNQFTKLRGEWLRETCL